MELLYLFCLQCFPVVKLNQIKDLSDKKMQEVLESQRKGMEKAKECTGTEGKKMGADSLEVNDCSVRDSLPKTDWDSLDNDKRT